MWRRAYLFLVLVRLYFALSPSYLHPDENFQGPEVIAGEIFNHPVQLTWEFTSANPIRSVFPLWLVYGLPMLLLRCLWMGNGSGDGDVPPKAVFWSLRVLMFLLSVVLEDWALYELVRSPKHRRVAVILVASSYVTWTYQTHTFSNSIETLTVSWSLVLIQRILDDKKRPTRLTSVILAFVVVLGVFNRITFPAFLLISGFRLVSHYLKRPFTLLIAILTGLVFCLLAIYLDTKFFTGHSATALELFSHPIITPINNLIYNSSTKNLAQHGLHPWYQHLIFNLPQLIGPAIILLFLYRDFSLRSYSAISGIIILSFFPHQEARFLLPAIPLLLSSVNLPRNRFHLKIWLGVWATFNLIFGVLMGTYHQGGVIPAQLFLSHQLDATHAVWWKTYSPPIWLLNGKNKSLKTHDMMGIDGPLLIEELELLATCYRKRSKDNDYQETDATYLIAPLSATFLDKYVGNLANTTIHFDPTWKYRKHLSLDDLDFGGDGVWPTLTRVIGRRGLAAWKITRDCDADDAFSWAENQAHT